MFNQWYAKNSDETPIYAAIGLSLVISNLAKPPFNGHVISFTDIPSLLSPNSNLPFTEQVSVIKDLYVGFSTNLFAVFTYLLLPMVKKYSLHCEDMVKRIFIFSDMEFDCEEAGPDQFLTTHESIRKEYKNAGYDVPELVWCNLATGRQIKAPVTKAHEGVRLLSGLYTAMVKTFLEGDLEEENEYMGIDMDESSEGKKPEEGNKRENECNKYYEKLCLP